MRGFEGGHRCGPAKYGIISVGRNERVDIFNDNIRMLEQDLEGEEDAITRYRMRIEQAEEIKELALAQQLRNILAVEQEHAINPRYSIRGWQS